MKVLAIASTKGGVGKSTAAFHLAYYFSSLGTVSLVDADPNRSSTNWIERSPVDVPFQVLPLDDAGKAKGELIILDSQIVLGEATAIAKDADLTLIPSTISALSVEAAMRLSDELQELNAPYKIFLNLVDPRGKATANKARQSLIDIGYEILGTQVRSYSAYEKAALKGLPVHKVSGKGGIAWGDYKALGNELREVLSDV